MRLADLVTALAPLRMSGSLEREITGIQYDSRLIQPGNLFVAIPGFIYDGHDYLQEAANRGAAAAIVSREVPIPEQLTSILVTDSRRALGIVAAKFLGCPSRKLRVIGVTGTNGKTTTTFLSENILRMAGLRTGLVGTVYIRIGDRELESIRTTPESLDLQHFLAQMVEAEVSHALLEVSSHALVLQRLAGCEFDVAVFTNLTQDHLDFHGDQQNYLRAKAQLFADLDPENRDKKRAIINMDDGASRFLLSVSRVPVTTYGIQQPADLRASDIVVTSAGTEFAVWQMGKSLGRTRVPTPGYFSVYNALAAIAVALNEGVSWSVISTVLPESRPIPGRFQPVRAGQPFDIIVDYAHTPDGLENILQTARGFTKGRVIIVFGCGGDRDRGKRPEMGRIASQLADVVIITTDNPRSESPLKIAHDIMQGVLKQADVRIELDRATAIKRAVGMASPGDTVLIAGKGHETYQVFADRVIYFDDREVAEQAVEVSKYEGLEYRRDS
ncbi:MAG: UDP-N-acetylmuramoyl-L-alanyl-D-glutamate--2,6-diaminopimelate ligase [Firmicutes bacterium]|nr:UDP-N-acetylmuramoyl-L-alanyl-D-glutamate--2,6-diaminopimelate ligase [Bacillota bacterium]